MNDPLLTRIADALDRAFPPPGPPADPDAPAYVWNGAQLQAVPFAPVPFELLTGIDEQKSLLLANTMRLASGAGAHDALLWGVRGSGKSALVKAAVARAQQEHPRLALIELSGGAIGTLPHLFEQRRGDDRPTIIFIDDIGFDGAGDEARVLRSLLDGGAAARPDQVRLYVTANSRHILPRSASEAADAVNARDVIEDRLALADRFGISIGFHVCDQATYLAMVAAYAQRIDLSFDEHDAIQFATQRGNRSGRTAWHYVMELCGRAGRPGTL